MMPECRSIEYTNAVTCPAAVNCLVYGLHRRSGVLLASAQRPNFWDFFAFFKEK